MLVADLMLGNRAGAVLVGACFAFVLVYWNVFARLIQDWLHDDNYSHGILIVPLAAYFIWERRARLRSLRPEPNAIGLLGIALGLLVLLAGLLGAELFLTRISILITLASAVVFVLGWKALRILLFPLGFLVLMIPIPAIIFNQIAFPLQLMASQAGETVLHAVGVPVLREGNVMILPRTTLEVAEACSGIRSLVSLLTLACVLGYFTDTRTGVRVTIAAAAVPIAIVTNAMRVAGTGIAAYYWGPEAAEGFFHSFSGWLVFVAAFLLLFLVARLLLRWLPPAHPTQPVAQPELS
jgi:exosortase